MRAAFVTLAFALLAAAAPVRAAPADDFHRLLADHYQWLLRENPVQATALGVRTYDDRLGDPSLAAEDRRAAEAAAFLARLEAIPAADLSPEDRTNRAILKRALEGTVEGNRYPQRTMLFTTYSGWHQEFADLPNNVPLRTKADFDSYLARLAAYPKLNDAALAVTAEAVKGGYVLPCSVLGGYDKTISGVIVQDPTKSRFYEPFTRPRPATISEADWAAMQARARQLIADVLNPAYARHLAFYRTEYLPHCAKSDSVSAEPGGRAWYAFRVRQETTTDLTPEQIHATGLREIARITAQMDAVAHQAGFATRADFIKELRTNPVYNAKSPAELMAAAALMAKTIDGKMPGLFGKLPRLSYGIRAIPAETAEGTTTAYYSPGSPAAGIAGTYYVNTSKLDQRPLWELPALTSHEAVPGHHNQIALQQELDLPPFRRYFSFYTAFTEGWALYAESLGEEIGLYDTPAKKMGQLSYQAWRAARLVVDTGIHAMGWDKARAVAFMRANTALSDANIDAEVNRYISWPGQALAYKLGELKIRELRTRAERELGPKFDLRRFHDAVLGQGSVPLDVLEAQINNWIAAEKAR
ncbi:MAG TPA: DUF885 domain-containing protein [Allosphingosinicella sp.]|jgi:uncharacterized protein (DUF885 family)|nr:DUF885 domain-containing protein [Allosphingosinicella sp.]